MRRIDPVERPPVEELHDHVVAVALGADLDGLHDVRVGEARGEARLVEEHRDVVLVARELGLQLLDDEQLVEASGPLRGREMDDPHPAARELGDEVILANFRYVPNRAPTNASMFPPIRTNQTIANPSRFLRARGRGPAG